MSQFECLPDDILLKIFGYLESDLWCKDLFCLPTVSSRFNGVLARPSQLWQTCSFRESVKDGGDEEAWQASLQGWLSKRAAAVSAVDLKCGDLVAAAKVRGDSCFCPCKSSFFSLAKPR